MTLSFSGTYLAQAKEYQPEVIWLLEQLYDVGQPNAPLEYLDESYYHSLTGLFSDPQKRNS